MKNSTFKNIIFGSAIIFLIIAFGNSTSAQGVQLTPSDYPYLYLSSAYVSSSSISRGTNDPYYAGAKSDSPDKTVRADFGIQVSKSVGFEAGYIRTPLWLIDKLSLSEEQPISIGGSSYTRINFYSFKFKHTLSLWKDKINLKSGLGYALGESNVDPRVLGPNQPSTSINYGVSVTETKTLIPLHVGNTHFMTFDLGLDIPIFRKLNLFSNITYYKGFTDLQQQRIDYIIDGNQGSFTTTTDGSFVGYELGLRYNFR